MGDLGSASLALSDEQLVVALRQGDQDAFGALVARYHPRLLRFCRQILRSTEDAEDALQDVFAAAFRTIVADDREIQVRPWLYRIARNRCLSSQRESACGYRWGRGGVRLVCLCGRSGLGLAL